MDTVRIESSAARKFRQEHNRLGITLKIPARYPNTDIALLHLGGTRVLGVMLTMDGKQGVELMRIVQPDLALPIHYNDYDVFKSPLEDFKTKWKLRASSSGFETRPLNPL